MYLEMTPRPIQCKLRHEKGPYLQICGGRFATVYNELCMQFDIYVFVFAIIRCAHAFQFLSSTPEAFTSLLHWRHYFWVLWQVEEQQWNLITWTPSRHEVTHSNFIIKNALRNKVGGNLWTWQTDPSISCSIPDIYQWYQLRTLPV
jgi:hypothetical protein